VYAGNASDGFGAVSIRVNRAKRRLSSFAIDVLIDCGSINPYYSLEHLDIPLRRTGGFYKRGISGIPRTNPDGSTVSGRYTVRGQIGARRASGTYRATGTLRRKDGTTAQCATGTVRWNARKG
jgi:hypothetical protein